MHNFEIMKNNTWENISDGTIKELTQQPSNQ